MDESQKKRLEEIMAGVECKKDFECCNFGFENADKADAKELLSYVTCAEDKEPQCEFKLPTGNNVLCSCPVRVHIAKSLKE